jgi:hypothetical protein
MENLMYPVSGKTPIQTSRQNSHHNSDYLLLEQKNMTWSSRVPKKYYTIINHRLKICKIHHTQDFSYL